MAEDGREPGAGTGDERPSRRLAVVRDEGERDDEKPGTEVAVADEKPRKPAAPAESIPVLLPGERKPVIPPQWQKGNRKATIAHHAGAHWYRARYHSWRLFLFYIPALFLWGFAGLFRGVVAVFGWGWDSDGSGLARDAALAGDTREYLRIHKHVQENRKSRGTILLILAALLGAGGYALWRLGPHWAWWIIGGVLLLVLSKAGRPEGHKIVAPAIVPAEYEIPTPEVITRGLGSLGISKIDNAIKDGRGLTFVTDVMRDGPGWTVQVDLPHGVTARNVIARREYLASGLRRPLSATWPEGVPGEHEGRLSLWIGFHDMAKTPAPKWPLAKSGAADLFAGVPFGTDPRQRPVLGPMFEANWLIGASPGNGKALALDTPVPTPAGWTTMGEIRDGDVIFGSDGQPCSVTRAWPVRHDRPCYEVQFSDGSVLVADAEHLWLVETRASRLSSANEAKPKRRNSPFSNDQRHKMTHPVVTTTAAMIGTLRTNGDQRANYSIRLARPLSGPDVHLPVDPYVLGAWLGDGTSASNGFTSADPEVIEQIRLAGVTVRHSPTRDRPYAYALGDTRKMPMRDGRMGKVNSMTAALRDLGVLNCKHIPVSYLRASEDQRRALLAGLLDTDGYCQSTGVVYFGVTNERLARDVRHLVSTLGYKSSLTSKPAKLNGRVTGREWLVTFTPADKVFRMQRKVARQVTKQRASSGLRYITGIRSVPSVPVRCITVDSADSLYLVGETCIPTHNTGAVRVLGLAAALDIRADLWVHELAGKGDLEALAQVSHRYCSGLHDEAVAYAADSLRMLRAELERRAQVFGMLKKEEKPDGKITPELAARGFRLKTCIIDEAQNLFMHTEYGQEAADDAAYVTRLGRAYGITLILATQRPDKDSMPTALSGLVTVRFCLKVPDYLGNDMILGTGSHKAGYNSVLFRHQTDAGLGWFKGDADPQIVKTYYIDLPAASKIAARARAMREKAGVLSGYALGLDEEEGVSPRDVLSDVLEVMGNVPGMHWDILAERMAERWPARWADLTHTALSTQVRAFGVPSVTVSVGGQKDKGCRRASLEEAIRRG